MQAITDKMLFTLPDFMATTPEPKKDHRPRPLKLSRSFIKPPPASPDLGTRPQRASTFQNGAMAGSPADTSASSKENLNLRTPSDVFEKGDSDDEDEGAAEMNGKLPDDFDQLPIELVSLSDSFIDSLSAKVHPTPPTVDKLSGLFQDFYVVAASHINTHISALSSRQHRSNSPAPTTVAGKIRAKAASISSKDRPKISSARKESEQQMLTTEEIAERKRARKVLEQKRVALEEAVERRVTEGIYSRIWRHRSTQDEAQDEKLRSKTAALSVVGIGLTDLGIDLGQESSENPDATGNKEKEVKEWLEGARVELIAMNDEKHPLGKLQHLKAAHKAIVDTLSHFHPSSSADEIMPMLIYTLITSRPEGIDVISNLYFIQRFRNEIKIDGEAAYCLTNLEAAITFLETVDLASLRADEKPSGPQKSNSGPTTPRVEKHDPLLSLTSSPEPSAPEVNSNNTSPTLSKSQPSPVGLKPIQAQNRRISGMFQPPAVLGAAGDAVMNTADQGFKTIGNSLGDSYKFLVGKLKERQEEATGKKAEIIVPKTLDDARKLVSTPPLEEEESASGASSLHSTEVTGVTGVAGRTRADSGSKLDDKVLSIIGGRKLARDRSTDSVRSASTNASSSKKVAFAHENADKSSSPLHISPAPTSAPSGNPAIVESMRNLGNSLNPINRIAGMGMMRGFGRSMTLPTTPTTPTTTPTTPAPSKTVPDGGVTELTTVGSPSSSPPPIFQLSSNVKKAFPDLAPSLPAKEVQKIAPPIKKFMDLQNPGELRINEVLELLRDYRRLAGALKDMGAV
ncbi:VPS9 domain protein [Drepanopeziza brunnea f. sp. 'multigermtubi' MB_m1]|uniref:VPS9 domain protein n=1 Tax=Marssonina brunnea f. sp. multigermtubi (strain MB_m1) TaxID=1072389 RepID=K1WMB9_MARBU|nr:VPS9 domain protein [Drepanopeziza brunnea f. sp. 'multigermtubi' MB_m1]EKD13477.1 VPS9 domain protein [Drepanopeziza brunnea f. sp. 'multigermtubi' MB_m1]